MIKPRCSSNGKRRPPLFQELFVGQENGFVATSCIRTRRGDPAGLPQCFLSVAA